MNTLWIATVFIVVVTLDQTFVSAVNRLCINADNAIRKLYIDGKDYTPLLRYRNNVRKCDCIDIPLNSGVIAVEAANFKNTAGIQSCSTAHPALEESWKCRPINYAKASNWYQPDFNDEGWKRSRGRRCNHCRRYYKLPCPMWKTKCYWSNRQARAVRCRIKQCADSCTGCQTEGYGKCDPGKCIHGSGVNVITGDTTCNRRCRLEMKAWGPNETADGYIRVRDLLTKSTDTWTANVPGDYYATVDMTNCTLTNKVFAVWSEVATKIIQQTFNRWNSDGPTGENFRHVIGVELAVGTDGTTNSFAPWISVAELGLGTPVPKHANYFHRSFVANLKGVQNGIVTVTDKVLVPLPPSDVTTT